MSNRAGTFAACLLIAACSNKESAADLQRFGKGLDTPFQFLVRDRSYTIVAGEHDADIMSSSTALRCTKRAGMQPDCASPSR
jgi:hypothetical protein